MPTGVYKRSPEHCRHMSEAQKKRAPVSLETRRKLSEVGKRRKGEKRSPETCKKLSEAGKRRKGEERSPEARRHMSEALKGRKLSPEHCKHISDCTYGTAICPAPGCGNTFIKTGFRQMYCPDCHTVPGYTGKLNHSPDTFSITRDQFRPLYETTYCPWCKCELNHDSYKGDPQSWTLDRIKPGSKGGLYTTENTQVLCRGCNASKGNRHTPSLERKTRIFERKI